MESPLYFEIYDSGGKFLVGLSLTLVSASALTLLRLPAQNNGVCRDPQLVEAPVLIVEDFSIHAPASLKPLNSMQSDSSSQASCRYCKHYEFEGHRGGNCQQLGVTVQGHWMACRLMVLALSEGVPDPLLAWSEREVCPLVYPPELTVASSFERSP